MSILNKLSTSLNRRDQIPNQQLAKQIASKKDKKAVQELIENLQNKSKSIQGDCIKTLYEIGEIIPELISGHAKEFIALLESKNNRLQWGAMNAIDQITSLNSALIYSVLGKISSTAEKGSVITKDHYVNILIKLCEINKYAGDTFPLLIEQLKVSLTNQLPKYAEYSLPLIHKANKNIFIKTLVSRLGDMESETKKKRLEKVIRRATSIGN